MKRYRDTQKAMDEIYLSDVYFVWVEEKGFPGAREKREGINEVMD